MADASSSIITSYTGKYFFLSNFYKMPVSIGDGLYYPTAEHAYLALRSMSMNDRHQIAKAPTIGAARKLSRYLYEREDWNIAAIAAPNDEEAPSLFTVGYVPLHVLAMEYIIFRKFEPSNQTIRSQLLGTGEVAIAASCHPVEDSYWGVHSQTLKGSNYHGRILMNVREKIREGRW